MLKISITSESNGEIQYLLEGSLSGLWVDELRRVSEGALANRKHLVFDLSRVLYVDFAGAELLRDLAAKNVSHTNCSQFVQEQFDYFLGRPRC